MPTNAHTNLKNSPKVKIALKALKAHPADYIICARSANRITKKANKLIFPGRKIPNILRGSFVTKSRRDDVNRLVNSCVRNQRDFAPEFPAQGYISQHHSSSAHAPAKKITKAQVYTQRYNNIIIVQPYDVMRVTTARHRSRSFMYNTCVDGISKGFAGERRRFSAVS
jgi:DNA-binding LytR/AlgR family response regulator